MEIAVISTWLTKQEAAAYARVSVSTIERAIRAGELRAGRTRGRVLIRREWIDQWLEGTDERVSR